MPDESRPGPGLGDKPVSGEVRRHGLRRRPCPFHVFLARFFLASPPWPQGGYRIRIGLFNARFFGYLAVGGKDARRSPRLVVLQVAPPRSPLPSSPAPPASSSSHARAPSSRGLPSPSAPTPPPAPGKAALSAPRFDSGGRFAYAAEEVSTAQLHRRGVSPQDEDATPLEWGGGSGDDDDSDHESAGNELLQCYFFFLSLCVCASWGPLAE